MPALTDVVADGGVLMIDELWFTDLLLYYGNYTAITSPHEGIFKNDNHVSCKVHSPLLTEQNPATRVYQALLHLQAQTRQRPPRTRRQRREGSDVGMFFARYLDVDVHQHSSR